MTHGPVGSESSAALVVFTKPAQAGRVKTRLIGALSPEQAAELHEAFLDDVSRRMSAGPFHLRIAWALEPGEQAPRGYGLGDDVPQRGAGLGERLHAGLRDVLVEHDVAAAIGSDHPDLRRERVEEAFRLLRGSVDVVFGPVEDGGYYLVGVRRGCLDERLFEGIAWSTETVLEESLARCRALGLKVELLAQGNDIDRPADLARLAGRFAADRRRAMELCPKTFRLLESWNFEVGEPA